ncbi:MAG: type IX secretion system membrane protein PorP/SprF [Bacteroidia bacterium]|nr:type IX secretion system membrane protein PorP/SprF [Bacteroidia bacterium]MDW8235084.1 type IX secretion system membrane protein PorP/SprF [Bacteroidia bacterium]
MKVWWYILGWCIWCAEALAQEILPIGFWSQPQALSPAFVGLTDGKGRALFTHSFRPATGFLSGSSTWAGVEAPLSFVNLIGGVGGYFCSDVAGAWRVQKGILSFAYEVPLGARLRYNHIRAGVAAGFVNRSIEPGDIFFEDQFDGRGFSRPTGEATERATLWHADYAIGAMYYRTLKVPGNPEVVPFGGFSISRLNRPSIGLLVQRAERLSMFWSGYGGARIYTRTPFQFVISLLYARSNQSNWIGGTGMVEFVLYEGGYWFTRPLGSVMAGFSLRARDQYALMAGFNLQKGLTLGIAYSLLTRRTTTPTSFGGIQVAMQYQLGYSYKERGVVYPFPNF